MGWNYLSIPKRQRQYSRWSLVMNTRFHSTLYNGYHYFSMQELKLNRVCKTHSWWLIDNEKLTANESRLLWSTRYWWHFISPQFTSGIWNWRKYIITDNIAVCVPITRIFQIYKTSIDASSRGFFKFINFYRCFPMIEFCRHFIMFKKFWIRWKPDMISKFIKVRSM